MDLKRLLSDYEAVRTELEGAKKKPVILREKVESAEKRLAELKGAIDAANRRKEQALVAFASGDLTDGELKAARSSLEAASKERTEIEEFLRASEKAGQQLQKAISDLSAKFIGCKHGFWNAVATELKSKITSDVIERVYVVYGAALLAGGAGTYENFLRQLIPLPGLDESQRVQRELLEKHGFTD